MSIKLVLCDFDGTITQTDALDKICDLAGKGPSSQEINSRFVSGSKDGKEALIERFSLLEGIKLSQIRSALDSIPLTTGAESFFAYTQSKGIKTLILSGNATFVLEHFSKKLSFSSFSGSHILIENDTVQAWDPAKCKCADKKKAALAYIEAHGFKKEEIIAIGDSIADEVFFSFAGITFLINKKSSVSADYEVNDFNEIILHLEKGR